MAMPKQDLKFLILATFNLSKINEVPYLDLYWLELQCQLPVV